MDAMVVVDMQVGLLDDAPKHDLAGVIQRINALAAMVRQHGGAPPALHRRLLDSPFVEPDRARRLDDGGFICSWPSSRQPRAAGSRHSRGSRSD